MSPEHAHTILVLGGIKSGKSEFAEALAATTELPVAVGRAGVAGNPEAGGMPAGPATAESPGESNTTQPTTVRYVATAPLADGDEPDPDWAARIEAHRQRRPAHWHTEDIGATPDRLPSLIKEAGPAETLLIDDLGGWFTALLGPAGRGDSEGTGGEDVPTVTAITAELVAAIESAAARIIVVSPEVGLALVPTTPAGRWFADTVGSANRSIAAAVDVVALVVAGRPMWLPADGDTVAGASMSAGTAAPAATAATRAGAAAAVSAATRGRADRAAMAPDVSDVITPVGRPIQRSSADPSVPVFAPSTEIDTADTAGTAADTAGIATDEDNDIRVGMTIPWTDTTAAGAAEQRSQRLPVAGAGMGGLTPLIKFVAGVRGEDRPQPFQSIRVIAITGTHGGAIGTGGAVPGWAHPDTADASALARLAGAATGVTIELLDTGVAQPIETGDVLSEAGVLAAMQRGWRRAHAAADRGDDVIVLAAGGPGVEAAAAATVAAITRAEVPALLPRVFGPDGTIDDEAWMERCLAIRDAVTKAQARVHDGPTALAAFGGASIATATGVLLGAARRRTPVIIDGPVGAAAALAARDYAVQVRLWCLLTDVAGDPTVRFAADRLGFEPVVSIGLGLGEGANALALLPLFQTALTAAGLADDPLGGEPAKSPDDVADSTADDAAPVAGEDATTT
jgi:adenosyl cobinamide kinase/adenosyl cobinamide phosphate guanylyltransferase/NaMN:DMB phosphoribosyltransferase